MIGKFREPAELLGEGNTLEKICRQIGQQNKPIILSANSMVESIYSGKAVKIAGQKNS